MTNLRKYSGWLAVGLIAAGLSGTVVAPAGASVDKAKSHKPAKPKAPVKPKKVVPGVGTTIKVLNQDKQIEAVKLVSVIDPASGADQYTTPDPGKRFVGVEVQITNESKGVDSNSADDNLAVVGTNKQVYSADLNSISECTDFNDGTYNVSKGESEVGCVTFQLPTAIRVAKVQYNPNAGYSTNNAEWTLTPPG